MFRGSNVQMATVVNNTVLHVETLLAEEILIILTTTKKKAKKGNYVRW